jgi:hypothetical protein
VTSRISDGEIGDRSLKGGAQPATAKLRGLHALWPPRLSAWLASMRYRPERHYMRGGRGADYAGRHPHPA